MNDKTEQMALDKYYDEEGNLDPVYEYIEEITKDVIHEMFEKGELRVDLKGGVIEDYGREKRISIFPTVWLRESIVYSGSSVDLSFGIDVIEDGRCYNVRIPKEELKSEGPYLEGWVETKQIGGIDLRINSREGYY